MPNFQLGEVIQLAIAPVFLLNAVAALIGALTQRLARVIDRSRFLQDEIKLQPSHEHDDELRHLHTRGRCINAAMFFLVVCSLFIGVTILEIFFAETMDTGFKFSRLVLTTFVVGIATFIISLILLLIEVLVASYSIRWRS